MISSDQLTKRVHFDDVKSHKRTLERTDATVVYYLLLGAHIVERGQVYHFSYLGKVDEWVDQPASANSALKLDGSRSLGMDGIG